MKINKCSKCGAVPMYTTNGFFWCECMPGTQYYGHEEWNEANPTKKTPRKSIRKQLRALEAELHHTDKCMAERLAKVTDQL